MPTRARSAVGTTQFLTQLARQNLQARVLLAGNTWQGHRQLVEALPASPSSKTCWFVDLVISFPHTTSLPACAALLGQTGRATTSNHHLDAICRHLLWSCPFVCIHPLPTGFHSHVQKSSSCLPLDMAARSTQVHSAGKKK